MIELRDTRRYYILGLVKGMEASNYFLMTFFDDVDNISNIAMFEPAVVSGV
jgi:hypothetical protein